MRDLSQASLDCIIDMVVGTHAVLPDIIKGEGYSPEHVMPQILGHVFFCTDCQQWCKMEDISAITGEDCCELCSSGEEPEEEIA